MKRVVTVLVAIATVVALVVLGAWVSSRQDAQRPYEPLLSSEMTATVAVTTTPTVTSATTDVAAQAPQPSRREQALTSQSEPPAEAAQQEPSASKDSGKEKSADRAAQPSTGSLHGLSLAQRKACYFDLIAAEDRAVAQADAEFPMDGDEENVKKHIELRLRLQQQFEAEVAAKYGLTSEQLEAIAEEGMANGWPMPPLTE